MDHPQKWSVSLLDPRLSNMKKGTHVLRNQLHADVWFLSFSKYHFLIAQTNLCLKKDFLQIETFYHFNRGENLERKSQMIPPLTHSPA